MMTNLKAIRKKAKMSQQNVADFLGMSKQGYSLIERGERSLKAETAVKLATLYKLTVDEVVR